MMRQTDRETATTPVSPRVGELLAESWRVEAILPSRSGMVALWAKRDAVDGRALIFLLDESGPQPLLKPELAELFGTVRHVLRDEQFGPLVIDEVPDGPSLAERLAQGGAIPLGLRGELQRRLRDAHHAGGAHGALGPEWIVLGAGELSLAGWGLSCRDLSEARARDVAALAALLGTAAEHESTGALREREDTGALPPGSAAASLRAAIVSDHLPTLRRAFESWTQTGGDPQDPHAVRARDALGRLEAKVAGLIADAERMLGANDVLGATAVCREAIRLGAEEQAEPLLRRARKQARSALQHDWFDRRRLITLGSIGLGLLLGGVLTVRWMMSASADEQRLRGEIEAVSRRQGAREAAQLLFGMLGRRGTPAVAEDLLAAQLELTAQEERARLVKLRSAAVAQGARPLQADEWSDRALSQLDQLASSNLAQPGLVTQFQRTLAQLDRAAALYQVSSDLTATEAAQAVDGLLAEDPVFGGGSR